MAFEHLPYTNFHNLNMDWIIEKVRDALDRGYSPENPPPYPVSSVNGMTGAVNVPVPEVLTVNGKTGHVKTPFVEPEAPVLEMDNVIDSSRWGIMRKDVFGDSWGLVLENENATEAPVIYARTKEESGEMHEARLLTNADIPESAGVVSVNGMAGVVNVDGNNLRYDSNYTLNQKIASIIPSINDKIPQSDIINDLVTDNPNKVLSAQQGKALNDKLALIGNVKYVTKENITLLDEINSMTGTAPFFIMKAGYGVTTDYPNAGSIEEYTAIVVGYDAGDRKRYTVILCEFGANEHRYIWMRNILDGQWLNLWTQFDQYSAYSKSYTGDLNGITTTGTVTAINCTNVPDTEDDVPYTIGFVRTMISESDNGYGYQVFYPANVSSPYIFARNKIAGAWNMWRSFSGGVG